MCLNETDSEDIFKYLFHAFRLPYGSNREMLYRCCSFNLRRSLGEVFFTSVRTKFKLTELDSFS